MATVTWLGEDSKDKKGNEIAGPSFTIWRGVKFPKGQPVEVSDKTMLAKAKTNQFFKVNGLVGRPPKDDDGNKNPE
jgi:hypothetical protein